MNWYFAFWLLVLVFIGITLISFIWVIAPFFPTRKKHLKTIEKIADLKPHQIFYEIGCGDARVSRYLAEKNPEAQIIGIEMSFPLFCYAWCRNIRLKNCQIKWKNCFWESLDSADVVYVFGMKKSLNDPLKKKFLAELRSGSKIISYIFSFEQWPGKTEIKSFEGEKTKIHQYWVE